MLSEDRPTPDTALRNVPVIDLFAGPGGLSFGFAGFESKAVSFRVALSIEKDATAYSTLFLRAFVRQFSIPPKQYYEFIKSPSPQGLEGLKSRFPTQWQSAENETKCWELGKRPFDEVSRAISNALSGQRDWLLLGGPPCQAYSLAGRSRMKNIEGFANDHRHTLYKEYLRVVAVHAPAIFVMENVKGILSSRHGARSKDTPIFHQILADLRDPAAALMGDPDTSKYLARRNPLQYSIYSFTAEALTPELLRPDDFVIKSEEWGIPQRRHRVILLGVRNDFGQSPRSLERFFARKSCSIESVIGGMPRIRSRLSSGDDEFEWRQALRKAVAAASEAEKTKPLSRVMSSVLTQLSTPKSVGADFLPGKSMYKPRELSSWLWDKQLGGIIQHEARKHMPTDLSRYYFSACFAEQAKRSPTLGDFPRRLLPKHKNIEAGGKSDFADRFRVQLKGVPATTITSHISKDGNYYIHYDPKQCRSLTVREAARLQTFPDSYFFFGGRTAQYHQVGNAVPPLLARKLARVVADVFERRDEAFATNPTESQAALV